MIESPGLLLTIFAFVLVIGPLIFVHELGHYLVGRWFGVHAETFAIDMSRGNTRIKSKGDLPKSLDEIL